MPVDPNNLSGFQDLLPQEANFFERTTENLKKVFRSYGYSSIDTPCIYRHDILTGGQAGIDKQLFEWEKSDGEKLGLRFDLTVPLARYIAANSYKLKFPFRRYDIGKVWRGERPQKGRFREFYQCDFDIVGTYSPMADVEIALIIYDSIRSLGVKNFQIQLNDRQILNGLLQELKLLDRAVEILRVLDKLVKFGVGSIQKELSQVEFGDGRPGLGIEPKLVEEILKFVELGNSLQGKALIQELGLRFKDNLLAKEGIARLNFVYDNFFNSRGINSCRIDLSLARGLGYYTGSVFETRLLDKPEIGSVASGGRYDNLASNYCKQNFPGVGASIGLSRLLSVLEPSGDMGTQILIVAAPGITPAIIYKVSDSLRSKGRQIEVYPQDIVGTKLGKQLKYASEKQFKFVVILGLDELARNNCIVRDMTIESQKEVPIVELEKHL
jgi:histidyl-tRNA synthetase